MDTFRRFWRNTGFPFVLLLILASSLLQAQTSTCTFRGSLTSATHGTAFTNNTSNPNCHIFTLTWNTTGFSDISIQLEGSDDNSTWTAFSGTQVASPTVNPSTQLSGAINVNANAKIAYLRVNVTLVTGSGTVNYQVYGSAGITANVSGGAGGTVTAVTASSPLASSGGTAPNISIPLLTGTGATVVLSASPALTGSPTAPTQTPGDNTTKVATDAFVQAALSSATVPFSAITPGTNTLGTLNCGTGCLITFGGSGTVNANWVNGGPIAVANTPVLATDSGDKIVAASVTGTGSTVVMQGSPAITTPTIADFTNSQHTHANAAGAGQLDNTAVKTANKAGAGTSFAMANALGTSGNCANWNANGIGDSGSPCGSGGSGGGVVTYSGPTLSVLSGTAFCPIGGGGACSATETNVDIDSPATATVSKMYVQLSQALGAGNSVAVTWRANASSQTVSCTISGAVATSCNDTTHSFTATTGDLLTYQLVFTGTIIVTPTITIASAFGTSNVGVTSVFGNTGPTVGATGDISATGRVTGINAVPLCTGFTPTNGQNLQYTTASSPNPCYTASTPAAGSSFPFTIVQESNVSNNGSGANISSITISFPQATASSGNTAWMIVATDGSQTVTMPAGWTVDINVAQASYARLVVLHKATASDTSAIFSVAGATTNWSVKFFEMAGSHTLDQSATGGVANTQTLFLPTITPTAGALVFGVGCWVQSSPPVATPQTLDPRWHPISNPSTVVNGGRALYGFSGTGAATHTVTTVPVIDLETSPLFSGGGVAYATFSII